jgi:hypothetical protein
MSDAPNRQSHQIRWTVITKIGRVVVEAETSPKIWIPQSPSNSHHNQTREQEILNALIRGGFSDRPR